MLFTLIVFAFNNQIRFNEKREFNLPVGKRDFNNNMRNKVRHFAEAIKNPHIELSSNDFRRIPFDGLSEHSLIYADPPYLITCATYNENNGWNAGSKTTARLPRPGERQRNKIRLVERSEKRRQRKHDIDRMVRTESHVYPSRFELQL